MLLEFGKAGWLGKARSQPDKVRQVIDKIKTDGLAETFQSVKAKLDQPLPLGYCNTGTVMEVGAGVSGFKVGDRVVSNGHHAEVVCVPKNLCAKVPDDVSDEASAFTVVGAIGLQGIRLAQPTLGESFVVTGLGLVGLLTVQLLRAHGCRVLGVDFDQQRLALAEQFGAEVVDLSRGDDPVVAAAGFSRGRGVDGVLITAATKSNELIHQAATMCRKRGRIILVGVAGTTLSRADFYEKELSFQVSCSYGPGRYDPEYELAGCDYPAGFVRWTVQRNFEAVLDTMAGGTLDPAPLTSHRFAIRDASQAYELIGHSGSNVLGLLLEYPAAEETSGRRIRRQTVKLSASTLSQQPAGSPPRVSVIGAGAFACRTLIPCFKQQGATLKALASQSGVTAALAGRRFQFDTVTTDIASVLSDPHVDAVVIATRHDSHAEYTCQALQAGKHVYVEKPLALNHAEVDRISTTLSGLSRAGSAPILMVGFNRRFAPHVQRMAELLQGENRPKSFVMTVNAGEVPADSWLHDPHVGGGRIVGEGCHFVDLLRFLCGHPIVRLRASMMGSNGDASICEDKASFTLEFADGSFGTVHYLANGHRGFPKERLEIFCGGRIIQLDNFRRLRTYGYRRRTKMNRWRQDKGHASAVRAFLETVEHGRQSPIPLEEIVEVTRISLDVIKAARTGEAIQYGKQATEGGTGAVSLLAPLARMA
jgi:predicted dehydrogenase/NADPH:quinone reductase-like Zn-dependent oxidoreductase